MWLQPLEPETPPQSIGLVQMPVHCQRLEGGAGLIEQRRGGDAVGYGKPDLCVVELSYRNLMQ